jgi:hypothetical protein
MFNFIVCDKYKCIIVKYNVKEVGNGGQWYLM